MRGIEQQFLALQKGFTELIPPACLRPFDERELELVISGIGSIDVADWRSHTRLKHCSPDTPVVRWFWQAVESYPEEMRARLLQFVTGSSRVPLQGFKALQVRRYLAHLYTLILPSNKSMFYCKYFFSREVQVLQHRGFLRYTALMRLRRTCQKRTLALIG